ncbi:MAG: non-canonical purine NTP pyrophosphatase [Fimbriimonadaceae bacterium]
MQIETLVIATHNAKKGGEMVTILSSALPETRILTLADFPGATEPEETGTTYQENAIIKAVSAFHDTGMTCLADDAGLEIDAMGGEPGLYSKRFAGEDTPFSEKMAIILDRLEGIESRAARFRCCIALASPLRGSSVVRQFGGSVPDVVAYVHDSSEIQRFLPNPRTPELAHRLTEPSILTIEATCEGQIALEPSGNGGFGYDPIFFIPELNCTMADLTADQKHQISHRGKVLRALCQYLSASG